MRDTLISSSDPIRILLVSDTHGPIDIPNLPARSEFDVMCHAGDWCPDPRGRLKEADVVSYQKDFIRYETTALSAFLGDTPFVFTLGNHDYLNPLFVEEELLSNNAKVINPNDQVKTLTIREKTLSFRGFRYIPWIYGRFCGELGDDELELKTEALMTEDIDVLISHCPPSGIIARKFGNWFLRNNLFQENAPKLILTGHIHETGGQTEVINKTVVVNGATTHIMVEFLVETRCAARVMMRCTDEHKLHISEGLLRSAQDPKVKSNRRAGQAKRPPCTLETLERRSRSAKEAYAKMESRIKHCSSCGEVGHYKNTCEVSS